ncbi:MAG: SlyX family protein [Desulfovibrionaceae bacterium]|nr:SlyX family protein [Desulfovibrionaceae bacterium]
MTDDERLTRLEETVYFQDRLIGELNTRITEQTCSLERVQARVGRLAKELADMRDLLAAAGYVSEIPPHSVPERFLTE